MTGPIELTPATLGALVKVITGGPPRRNPPSQYGPYQSGPDLIEFFRPFGGRGEYGDDFGARTRYTRDQLHRLNGTDQMREVIEATVDPRRFLDTDDHSVEDAAEHLNEFLRYDGWHLVESGGLYRLRSKGGIQVGSGELAFVTADGRHEFIDEHLGKAEQRLEDEDYTGAITAARTLVEEVLLATEDLLDLNPPSYNGKLSPLYSRVFRLLNLDPSQEGLHDSSREVLSGLISVVSGLAPMRNKASDAHPSEYRPYRHHAELAVNSAKTIVNFIDGTLTYQLEKGYVQVPGEPDE